MRRSVVALGCVIFILGVLLESAFATLPGLQDLHGAFARLNNLPFLGPLPVLFVVIVGLLLILVGAIVRSEPLTREAARRSEAIGNNAGQSWKTCATCKRIVDVGADVCPICGGPTVKPNSP